MSYEIVYDRRFIRTPLGITPLILAGSSNCYEPMPGGRERRERNWSPLFNYAAVSEDELMARVQSCCGGKYQEHFKRNGKFVDDAGFVNFIRNGINSAVTLEELDRVAHCGPLRCSLSIWYRDSYSNNRQELGQNVCTTEELVRWITEARQRVENRSEREEIYYSISFFSREPIHFPFRKAIDGPVIAKRGTSYVSNCCPGRLETSGDISKARVFTDMNEAIDKLSPYFVKGTRFMKAENAKARQSWRFFICVQGGPRDGMFMESLTRSRFHMTYHQNDARRFPDRKTAERFIEKRLMGRFSMPGYTVYEIPQNGGDARA